MIKETSTRMANTVTGTVCHQFLVIGSIKEVKRGERLEFSRKYDLWKRISAYRTLIIVT
jgi:hypothetical protein